MPGQFSAVDVVTDNADDADLGGRQRGEVGDDIRRPAESVIVALNRLGPEACLDGDLGTFRREDPVCIKAEVAVDGNFDAFDFLKDLGYVFGFHSLCPIFRHAPGLTRSCFSNEQYTGSINNCQRIIPLQTTDGSFPEKRPPKLPTDKKWLANLQERSYILLLDGVSGSLCRIVAAHKMS